MDECEKRDADCFAGVPVINPSEILYYVSSYSGCIMVPMNSGRLV